MNTLSATITSLTASEHLSCICVAVGEDTFHLLLAECSNAEDLLQTNVTLAFKETEVILSKERYHTTANIAQAIIHEIKKGVVLSEVILNYQESTVTTLVPTVTLDTLNMLEGDTVNWMVQPNEISLLRGHDGI
jgi:molybdopterin-binding protein